MAIDAAQMAPEQATRAEVRAVAQQIVEKQQQEIDQLKAWRLEGYGNAEPEPTPMP